MQGKTLVALLIGCGLLALVGGVLLFGTGAGAQVDDPPGVVTLILQEDADPPPQEEVTVAWARAQIEANKTVEQQLAEEGEDPKAVFYMSRIREAIDGGNPDFANELLRQMKEEHKGSALVEPAEDLFTAQGE